MSRRPAKTTPKEVSDTIEGSDAAQQLTYRHFENFRNTYYDVRGREEKLYGKVNLRNIAKNLKPIEGALGGALFTERSDGKVFPSPLADRLFNDSGEIEASMKRLMAKVSQIRESRVLRIGACEATFQTDVFRRIFRTLGAFNEFRIAYVAVAESDAGSALAQGRCDWFFGITSCKGERYTTDCIAEVTLKIRQKVNDKGQVGHSRGFDLPVDTSLGEEPGWGTRFERPKKPANGHVVLAPEIHFTNRMRNLSRQHLEGSSKVPLLATRLRHHPYGFLHSLPSRLKQRISNATDA